MNKLQITEQGKCPVDLIKPLTYKRDEIYFCNRCSRSFNLDTGEWVPNWCWLKPFTMHSSAGVVAARDTGDHSHEWIEIKDNDSFNCVQCGLGVTTEAFYKEHSTEDLL